MGKAKEFIGTVISNKMQKTIIVNVVRASKHPKYGRIVKQTNKFKVHDEKNTAAIGDKVRIRETRPISKDKRYRMVEVLKKVEVPAIEIKE
jgi:small subunit ribosomal protein S17